MGVKNIHIRLTFPPAINVIFNGTQKTDANIQTINHQVYHCGGRFSTCDSLLKNVITPSTNHIHMLVYIWKGTYCKELGD